MNKRKLYESIMRNVAKTVKRALNENSDSFDNRYYPKTKKELQSIIQDLFSQGIYNLNCIDVSQITDFSELFANYNINFDVSRWDVSNGTDFSWMFAGCRQFNCDLSMWDVHHGTDFRGMFRSCRRFNGDLSRWDVHHGTDFCMMFFDCRRFNCDLSAWNVSKGTDFDCMFDGCKSNAIRNNRIIYTVN